MEVKLQSVRTLADNAATMVEKTLAPNELVTQKTTVALPANLPFSQPYWLREPGTPGTYAVSDQTLIGRPENPPAFPVEVTLQVGGEEITYSLAPRFRKVDRVAGEVSEPLVIAPPAFVGVPQPVFVFGSAQRENGRDARRRCGGKVQRQSRSGSSCRMEGRARVRAG